jgi:argininosuccinate synthase
MSKQKVGKVVLAYSGGLDTSVIVPWLKENYDCEVICVCANIGQGDDLTGIEAKAIASGASKCYVEDLREEFITEYIYPTLQAGAIYERKYLLGTSFARPLIAKRQVEIAQWESADAVAHGCTGKGNDQVRFELTYQALNPKLRVIAPWREWSIRSRQDALAYARAHNVPVASTEKSIYSRLEHLASVARRRPAGRPVAGAGVGDVPVDGRSGANARHAGIRRDRVRSRCAA